jgi:hypothetical protein
VEASDIEESDDEHPAQKIAISLDAVRDVMIQELGSHHDKIESWLRPLVAFKVDKNSVQSGAINDAVRDTLKEETGSHRDKKEAMPRSSLFNHSGMFGYTGVFGDTGMKTKRSDTRDFGTQTDTASAAQNEEFSRPGEQSGLSSPKENGELIPVRLPIISIEGSGNMTSTSKSPISSDMKEVPHAEEVAHAEDVLDDKDILDETEVSTMSKQQVSSLRPTLPPPSNVKEGSKESEQQNSGLRPALFPFPDAKEGNSRSEKQNSSFLFFGADRTERSRKAEQQNSDLQPFLFRFPNAKDQSSKLGPQSSGRLSLRAKSEEPFDWKTYKDVKFDFECKPRG